MTAQPSIPMPEFLPPIPAPESPIPDYEPPAIDRDLATPKGVDNLHSPEQWGTSPIVGPTSLSVFTPDLAP